MYAVITFIFWILGLDWLEKLIFEGIDTLNEIIADFTEGIFEKRIDIKGTIYPKKCFDCGFDFSKLPKLNIDLPNFKLL